MFDAKWAALEWVERPSSGCLVVDFEGLQSLGDESHWLVGLPSWEEVVDHRQLDQRQRQAGVEKASGESLEKADHHLEKEGSRWDDPDGTEAVHRCGKELPDKVQDCDTETEPASH